MQLVALFQSTQNRNRRFNRGLIDQNLLETPLQSGVFFDVFAILIQGRCTDAMQLTARQGRFEHVAGVHRPLGFAGADHRVDLVNKDNRPTLVFGDIGENAFETLFKFAAVLRPREQSRQIKRQHALVLETIGHRPIDDALRQTLDNRGLANAGFANQYWIIFCAPLQDLNRAPDFVVAPNHWVEFALTRPLGEVDGVLAQGFALGVGIVTVDGRPTADRVDRGLEGFAVETRIVGDAPDFGCAFVRLLSDRQQKQFRSNKLIAALECFFLRLIQQLNRLTPHL